MKIQLLMKTKNAEKMMTVLAFNFSDVVFIMLMNVLKNANKIQ